MQELSKYTYEFTDINEMNVKIKTEYIPVTIIGIDANVAEIKLVTDGENQTLPNIENYIDFNFNKETNTFTITTNDNEMDELKNVRLKIEVCKNAKVTFESENSPASIKNILGALIVNNENGPLMLDSCICDVKINTENGPVSSKNGGGFFIVDAENSPITINDFNEGKIKINTENSPINISKCVNTDLFIDSENSPIGIKNINGKIIKCSTENGLIKVLNSVFSNANLETENGGIYFDFGKINEGSFKFCSENARISLVIPSEVPINLHAENENGRIHMGLQGNYESDTRFGHKSIKMKRLCQKVKINVESENGSIILLENPKDTAKNNRYNYKDKYEKKYNDKYNAKWNSKNNNTGFDFNNLGNMLENAFSQIPETFRKMDFKNKFKNIFKEISPKVGSSINDVMKEVSKAIKEVKTELKKAKDDISFYAKQANEQAKAEYEEKMQKYEEDMKQYYDDMKQYEEEVKKANFEYEEKKQEAEKNEQPLPKMPEMPEVPEKPEKPVYNAKLDTISKQAGTLTEDIEEKFEEKVTSAIKTAFANKEEKPMKDENKSSEKLKVLELLEKGVINVEDAEKLINAMEKK